MAEVLVINPTKTILKTNELKRVGAYIRVSSDSDDQENSFITQYDHYMKLIGSNPDWTLADIYKDNGITGTEMEYRDDFNRMYRDCADGKIDLILTKSISRFARNTYDCIDMTRKLKILGVDVIFEKENVDTSKMTSETELAALSSMAQEESISLSQNVQMGIRHRMKNGTFKQGCLPYGYYLGENGEWKINEEQAKIVRIIFNAYMGGTSLGKIANELNRAGVPKGNGSVEWEEKRIGYIIKNERYKGDALLQKTYTEDFPFKSRTNNGEKDMYYVKNHNPAIVSAETFDKANALLKAQGKRYRPGTAHKEHIFSKMLYCEECGTMYRKKSGEINVFWVCRKRDHDASLCPAPQIAEKAVMKAFVNMYNRIVLNTEIILTPILTQLTEYKSQRMLNRGEISNINKEIAELTEQVHVLQNAKAGGYIEPASFMERMNVIATRTAKLRKDKKFLLGNDECEQARKKTEMLVNYIKAMGAVGEFDEKTFKKTVNKVFISRNKDMTFELINGLKLKIKYSEVE